MHTLLKEMAWIAVATTIFLAVMKLADNLQCSWWAIPCPIYIGATMLAGFVGVIKVFRYMDDARNALNENMNDYI